LALANSSPLTDRSSIPRIGSIKEHIEAICQLFGFADLNLRELRRNSFRYRSCGQPPFDVVKHNLIKSYITDNLNPLSKMEARKSMKAITKKNYLGISLLGMATALVFGQAAIAASPAPMSSKSGMSGMSTMNHPTATPSVAQASPAPGGGTFLNQPIPAKVLSVPLFDTNGKTITLGSLKGQTVVIADFLTSCQEICPMTSANMRQIGDAVAASKAKGKVTVLEVSVDGWRDTASRLKAYQGLFNDTNWLIAGGTTANLNSFWNYFGASIQKAAYTAADMKKLPVDWQTGKVNTFDISHTDEVVIVGPNSTWSWLDLGNPNPGKDSIPAKLKAYLDEDGLNNLAKPQEPSWSPAAVYSALKTITGVKVGA